MWFVKINKEKIFFYTLNGLILRQEKFNLYLNHKKTLRRQSSRKTGVSHNNYVLLDERTSIRTEEREYILCLTRPTCFE